VDIPKGFSMSDVEPLVQLRGSLEELSLCGSDDDYGKPSIGLRRFPESFLGLTEVQKLALNYRFRIKAIPAGISNLKELKWFSAAGCDLRSLPKDLGALSQLEMLFVFLNKALGSVTDDVAFPKELKGMASLRELCLLLCGLRRVPAFVRELSSLEEIRLDNNHDLQIDAPLDD
jgi:leucine-rich repeat protein SHOC2